MSAILTVKSAISSHFQTSTSFQDMVPQYTEAVTVKASWWEKCWKSRIAGDAESRLAKVLQPGVASHTRSYELDQIKTSLHWAVNGAPQFVKDKILSIFTSDPSAEATIPKAIAAIKQYFEKGILDETAVDIIDNHVTQLRNSGTEAQIEWCNRLSQKLINAAREYKLTMIAIPLLAICTLFASKVSSSSQQA